jgi:hypothetical protein
MQAAQNMTVKSEPRTPENVRMTKWIVNMVAEVE